MHESMNTGHWWKHALRGREKWRKGTSRGTTLSNRYIQPIGLGLKSVLGDGRTVNNNPGHGKTKMFKYTFIFTLSLWKFTLGQLIIVIEYV
jgi:hypothetical protein